MATADYISIYRWEYANIGKQTGDSHLIDVNEGIGACGDWLIQGRIEAAFSSGYELAKKLVQYGY